MIAETRPSRIEYDLGRDTHNRPIKLIFEKRMWRLERTAANQRDELARIDLTPEQAAAIGTIMGKRDV